ncbi:transporter [Rudanella paleaurantiibacter]|uniref:Transporter n=1 Tax=Rudanella paleaurantiibacter TaxID=2614655 RepID=A0A7J5U2D0_9BACT|nr:TolC family protein [Rudanella paleaurantiibacter]KAB7731937.1 transporter [Rudanella paleaurantiibacter]
MKLQLRYLLGLAALWPGLLMAQPQPASILDEYVQLGLQNNLALRQETLDVSRVTESLNQARALFYPRLTFNPTYSMAAGGRRLQFPIGDLLNPIYGTLNHLTGSDAFPTNLQNVNELLAPNNFHDTKVSVQFALYNTDIHYNYLIQKNLLSAQEARRQVIENELRYNITTAYYQYLQTLDAIRIFENSRTTLRELVRLNQKLVANNVATRDVVSSAEYEVSKLDGQLASAQKNRETARSYLNFLLNRDLLTAVNVDSSLLDAPLPAPTESVVSLEETALAGRKELTQLQGSLRAAQTAIRLNEANAKLPSVYVGGNAGFQGFGYTFRNQAYTVGQLGLSWDLFKGYEKRSKIQQARIRAEQLQTKLTEVQQQIRLQVVQAYYELEAAEENGRATRQGVTAASQTLRVIDSKYRNGQALLIEFLKAQNDYLTAQIGESLARMDVRVKRAALDRVTAVR